VNQANTLLTQGPEWSARVAPKVLALLLGAARAGRTLTYSQLDAALHEQHGEDEHRRKTVYSHPLERIGQALEALAREWRTAIPPLTALVVTKDDRRLPGEGADGFINHYLRASGSALLAPATRGEQIEAVHQAIWAYPDWDKVGRALQVLPQEMDSDPAAPATSHPAATGEESPAHQRLKRWAASHPGAFAALGQYRRGWVEYPLASGDRLDVFLASDQACLAIEVKTSQAPEEELKRGLYQCVKYRATLEAMYRVRQQEMTVQAVLFTPQTLPPELRRMAAMLDVPVLPAPRESEDG
jgi:hypothetical protein